MSEAAYMSEGSCVTHCILCVCCVCGCVLFDIGLLLFMLFDIGLSFYVCGCLLLYPRQSSLAADSLNTQMCGLCVIPPESPPASQVVPCHAITPVVNSRDTTNANIARMFKGPPPKPAPPSKAVPTASPVIGDSVSSSGAVVSAAAACPAPPTNEPSPNPKAPPPSRVLVPATGSALPTDEPHPKAKAALSSPVLAPAPTPAATENACSAPPKSPPTVPSSSVPEPTAGDAVPAEDSQLPNEVR